MALGYFRYWDFETCAAMTTTELIESIGLPPKSIDNSNPDCPIIVLQDLESITEEMLLNKWNEVSPAGKDQIRLNLESQHAFF